MTGTPGSSSGGVTPQPQGLSGPGTPGGGPTSQQSAAAAAQAAAAKKRRWYLGIQSKKDPAHVMTEVYKALLQVSGGVQRRRRRRGRQDAGARVSCVCI